MTCDIYLKYDESTSLGCIVIRYKENGNVVYTRELYTGWGESGGYGTKTYQSIVLENIVSPRNNPIGFRIIARMYDGGSGKVFTYSSLDENSAIVYRDAYPVPFSRESVDNNTTKYSDINVLLPADLTSQGHYYGGRVNIIYDVEQSV